MNVLPMLWLRKCLLENSFSWSKSRDEEFKECQRKYFYARYLSWGGWDVKASKEIRLAYILKNIKNRWAWKGERVHHAIEAVMKHVSADRIAGHFHDTYGQAIANVYAALECGVATFDASVAGLGGCPYAKGATGNVATEDVLYMLDGLGIETGVDMAKLAAAGEYICGVLGRPTHSKAARALAARKIAA